MTGKGSVNTQDYSLLNSKSIVSISPTLLQITSAFKDQETGSIDSVTISPMDIELKFVYETDLKFDLSSFAPDAITCSPDDVEWYEQLPDFVDTRIEGIEVEV